MTSIESLEKYGTISFGIDWMIEMISIDNVANGHLDLRAWIASIPVIYQTAAIAAVAPVAQRLVNCGMGIDVKTMHSLVHEMHGAVLAIVTVPA